MVCSHVSLSRRGEGWGGRPGCLRPAPRRPLSLPARQAPRGSLRLILCFFLFHFLLSPFLFLTGAEPCPRRDGGRTPSRRGVRTTPRGGFGSARRGGRGLPDPSPPPLPGAGGAGAGCGGSGVELALLRCRPGSPCTFPRAPRGGVGR